MVDRRQQAPETSQPESEGALALGALLDESAQMRPDELPLAVRSAAGRIGLEDATVYVVDKDQRRLVPLGAGGGEPLPIDASIAGRAFRTGEPVETGDADGLSHVWFPMRSGRDRMGVLGGRVVGAHAQIEMHGRRLAALTADLVSAKAAYGDNILLAMRREHPSLAAEMRWSLLPPLTFAGRDVSMAGYFVPAYEIAGDAFDYAINGDTAHVAIIDARGHGLTASRIANLAVAVYRHSRRLGYPLERVYEELNDTIEAELGAEMFATAQIAELDLVDGTFRWLNAGHPEPLLLRGGRSVQQLAGETSLPVGFDRLDNAALTVNTAALEPGDVVVFYSDGVTEARSGEGEEFGVEGLADFLVRAAAAGENLAETARRLIHSVVEHVANQDGTIQDDATVFLVAWRA